MRALRAVAARLLAHGGAYGAEMLDDLLELYRERRHTYGRFHAVRRACWDFLTLFVRAAPPRDAFAIRGSTMPRLVHDVRHAWRALTRRPLVTVTAMFTLALGMTLALLAFAVIEGVMLRPLPFPNSHELLSLVTEFRPESGYTFDRFALSAPEIEDYRSQSRLVDVAAWTPASVALIEDDGTSRPLPGIQAASGVFRLLDVRPLSGRTLEARDDVRGAPCSVVIGEPLWRERFAASAS